jgi:hypothetical protein
LHEEIERGHRRTESTKEEELWSDAHNSSVLEDGTETEEEPENTGTKEFKIRREEKRQDEKRKAAEAASIRKSSRSSKPVEKMQVHNTETKVYSKDRNAKDNNRGKERACCFLFVISCYCDSISYIINNFCIVIIWIVSLIGGI